MSKRVIEVIDYDPTWAIDFEQEKALLLRVMGETATNVEHIGSTAVVGLSAKPIIDILVEVKSLTALDQRSKKLETLGYQVKGENGISGRRYFQKGGVQRTHHVHAFLSGDANLIRHRAFKEYLIAHPKALDAYARIKKQAIENCNNDISQYMAMKHDFIQHHEQLALKWYAP